MIITCKKCSTRFNLDESFLKPGGSKVRCSQCKNIFTAFPPGSNLISESEPEIQTEIDLPVEAELDEFEENDFEAEPVESDEIELESFESDFQNSELEDEGIEFDESDFEIESTEPEIEDPVLEMKKAETNAADIEISFDQESEGLEIEMDELTFENEKIEFEESDLDIETTDLDIETTDLEENLGSLEFENFDQETLTLEADDEQELEFSFEEDTDDFDSKEKTGLPEPLSPIEEEKSDTLPDDNFSSYDQVLNQDTEPEDNLQEHEGEDEQAVEIEEPPVEGLVKKEKPEQEIKNTLIEKSNFGDPIPGRSRKRKRKSTLGAPVMILLLVFLIAAAAYIASLSLGYKIPYLSNVRIPFLEQYLKKETPAKTELKPIPNEGSVNGRFVSNDTAGELFVITGRIENPSTIAYSHIQVKGTLITKGKAKSKTLIVFCGNTISEELLKTGNILDINKQLTLREGSNNSNVNMKPGGFVPFMLVFSNLPENLENFTVEVVADPKTETNK